MLDEEFHSVLAAAQTGVEWAWTRLYESVAGKVIGYLRLRGAHEPEDLLGEVFVQVARNIKTFEGTEQGFRSWVFTVAHHRLIDERRYRSRRSTEPSEDIQESASGGDVEEEALALLGESRVRALLCGLSPDQRDVLLLRVLGDLSVAEIAAALDKTPGAVKALHHRGVTALRAAFSEAGVTD